MGKNPSVYTNSQKLNMCLSKREMAYSRQFPRLNKVSVAVKVDTSNCYWVYFFSSTFHTENIPHSLDIWNTYVSASTLYFLSGMNTFLYYIYLWRYHNSLSLHMYTCNHMQKMVNLFNAEGNKFGDLKKGNLD